MHSDIVYQIGEVQQMAGCSPMCIETPQTDTAPACISRVAMNACCTSSALQLQSWHRLNLLPACLAEACK